MSVSSQMVKWFNLSNDHVVISTIYTYYTGNLLEIRKPSQQKENPVLV